MRTIEQTEYKPVVKDVAGVFGPMPSDVFRDLLSAVNWALSREEDAAATILKLAYRIESNSELAGKARDYAAKLKLLIARLKAALPRDGSRAASGMGASADPDPFVTALTPQQASTVLIKFLLQHAETTSEILQSAGARLSSKQVAILWRRAEKERRQLASWVHEIEQRADLRPKPEQQVGCAPSVRPAFVPDGRQLVRWM